MAQLRFGMLDSKILVDYIPAELHECKSRWYISYYAYNPTKQKLQRKTIKVNRIKSKTEKRLFAKRLVQKINRKLIEGWNPFIEQEAPKSFFCLSQAIKSFLYDKRSLRSDSLRSYKNFLNLFQKWSVEKYKTDILIISIDNIMAVEYMEDVWKRKIESLRYNNFLAFQILFCNWLIEHKFAKANPFMTIKKRKVNGKIRIMDIDKKDRKKINEYLRFHNRQYYTIVLLAFHCLLRPKEITFLKGKHFDLKKQAIFIDGEFAKNHHNRIATIPNHMLFILKEILKDVKNDEYVFSKRNLLPGKEKCSRRYISRYWENLRDHLEIKKEVQFYSLRDSGIIQKLRDGIDPKTVMELADHSSLEVTNKYVKMATNEANKVAMKKMTKF